MTQVKQEIEEGNFSTTKEKAPPMHYTIFGEDKGLMTRDYCVEVHKKLHEIGLVYMKNLKGIEFAKL